MVTEYRLVEQVHEHLSRRCIRIALDECLAVVEDHRLAFLKDRVEHLFKTLTADVRERLEHRLADELAASYQLVVRLVRHLDHVVFAHEHRNEARGLVEQRLQLVALDVQDPRHGLVHLRPVELGHVRHRVCAVLEEVELGRGIEPIEIGHVDRVLQDKRHVAARIGHRRMHHAPIALVEHGALRCFTRHGIAEQCAGMRFSRFNRDLNRPPNLFDVR